MISLPAIADLFAREETPPPALVVEEGRCLRRFKNSQCDLCFQACLAGAITLDRAPGVDREKCANCGACAVACPTGVLAIENLAWKRLIFDPGSQGRVQLSCARNSAAGSSSLPCLGCLGSGALLAIGWQGTRGVDLLTQPCSSCDLGGIMANLGRSVEQANAILDLFEGTEKIEYASGKGHGRLNPSTQRLLSRRQLFSFVGGREGRETEVSGDGTATGARPAASGDLAYPGGQPIHQSWLSHSITRLLATRAFRNEAATLPVGNVVISDPCQLCHLCTSACPEGALILNEDDYSFCIQFEAARCVECRLCADLCPCNAVFISRGVSPTDYGHGRRTPVARRTKTKCNRCGGLFPLRSGEQICAKCDKEVELETSLSRPMLATSLQSGM